MQTRAVLESRAKMQDAKKRVVDVLMRKYAVHQEYQIMPIKVAQV